MDEKKRFSRVFTNGGSGDNYEIELWCYRNDRQCCGIHGMVLGGMRVMLKPDQDNPDRPTGKPSVQKGLRRFRKASRHLPWRVKSREYRLLSKPIN